MSTPPDMTPTDAELIAVLEGRADEATMARIASAMERNPAVERRLAALDAGVPHVSKALDAIVAHAPAADLSRAFEETLALHATRASVAAAPAYGSALWWAALLVVGALAFTAGLWVGLEGREQSRNPIDVPGPAQTLPAPIVAPPQPPTADAPPPSRAPSEGETPVAVAPPEATPSPPAPSEPTRPPAIADAAEPKRDAVPEPAPIPPPALAEAPPPPPAPSEPTRPPAIADAAEPKRDAVPEPAPIPPPALAEAPPPPAPSEPTRPPAIADAAESKRDAVPEPAPTPPPVLAQAPERPNVTPWVEAVANYVRLMTAETLQQTALPAGRQRAQLATASRRFGVDLRALVGSVRDYTLQRIEVLQLNGRPLLQLGFLDPDENPVAVCILLRPATAAAGAPDGAPPVFQEEAVAGLSAVHWNRQPRGFLVIGRAPSDRLADVARRIARAL